ncbi:MAG: AAA family ATPase [Acidimicrobiia bacterium]|nr:AAA family ATPase [Acidimicrobiia bacterium]
MDHDQIGTSLGVRETHISRLFFTPDRVYKLLKPVETPFVSYVDPDERIVAATNEFELNHRLAPDVYLGTADVEEQGRLVERMIVMRRLPEERQLDRLATAPDATIRVWEAAKHIAALHASEPPITDHRAEAASVDTLARRWAENFDAIEPLAGTVIDRDEFESIRTLVGRYIEGRNVLFAERIAHGWVRDGHGDLRAEHIFCLDDGPRVIDCLAFRDDFRIGDALNDIAFLAMDLHRLAGPELARSLMHDYCEFTYEHHPSTLAHHYVAYRAHVRAKIAAIRLAQGDETAADEVVAYHRLAHEHLSVGRVRLVLVGGAVGVGKSTVANGLAAAIGATWLRTDEVRKATGDGRPPKYNPEAKDQVYRDLIAQAETLLARGESVVLDATWSSEHRRSWARELAERTHSTLTSVQVIAPLELACQRLQVRRAVGDDPSDSTPELARRLDGSFESWPEALLIPSDRTITETVDAAVRSVIGPVSDHTADGSSNGRTVAPASAADTSTRLAELGRNADRVSVDYAAVRFYLRRAGKLVPDTSYVNTSYINGPEQP